MNKFFFLLFLLFTACAPQPNFTPTAASASQRPIPRVEKMPNRPKPYVFKDWKKTAQGFDQYAFDFSQKGDWAFFPRAEWGVGMQMLPLG